MEVCQNLSLALVDRHVHHGDQLAFVVSLWIPQKSHSALMPQAYLWIPGLGLGRLGLEFPVAG